MKSWTSIISKNCKNIEEEVDYVHVEATCCIDVLIIAETLDQVISVVDDETREDESPDTPDHLLPDSPQREDNPNDAKGEEK